ncbi:MAG: transposase [Cytophagaceae bacterium]|nr:MAG: transposase [Cytophagaceae bacterium]
MSLKNRLFPDEIYFLTMTVVDWVDVFTRPAYRHIIVDALRYCQQHKGLELYAWCLMSNHLHLIARAAEDKKLSDILRDFKRHTSRAVTTAIQRDPESRREWLLHRFSYNARLDAKSQVFKFWQEGNEAKALLTPVFTQQKLDYLHQNPVRAEWVREPEDYIYSSASNYAEQGGLLEVLFLG